MATTLQTGYVHIKVKGALRWLAVAPNGDTKAFFTLSECRAWIDRANRSLTGAAQ